MSTTTAVERWVWPGILSRVEGRWRLVGVECDACSSRFFPSATVCASCLGETLRPVPLSPTGDVHSVTVVRMASPGFEAPYGLAWVDLSDGVRVFGRLANPKRVRVGDLVEVTLAPVRIDPDGVPVHGHVFQKVSE